MVQHILVCIQIFFGTFCYAFIIIGLLCLTLAFFGGIYYLLYTYIPGFRRMMDRFWSEWQDIDDA